MGASGMVGDGHPGCRNAAVDRSSGCEPHGGTGGPTACLHRPVPKKGTPARGRDGTGPGVGTHVCRGHVDEQSPRGRSCGDRSSARGKQHPVRGERIRLSPSTPVDGPHSTCKGTLRYHRANPIGTGGDHPRWRGRYRWLTCNRLCQLGDSQPSLRNHRPGGRRSGTWASCHRFPVVAGELHRHRPGPASRGGAGHHPGIHDRPSADPRGGRHPWPPRGRTSDHWHVVAHSRPRTDIRLSQAQSGTLRRVDPVAQHLASPDPGAQTGGPSVGTGNRPRRHRCPHHRRTRRRGGRDLFRAGVRPDGP